jgi:cell division protein FtsW
LFRFVFSFMRTVITLLAFSVSSLLALGLVMLYSAGDVQKAGGTQYFVAQLISFGIGLSVCIVASSVHYRYLRKMAWLLFLISVALLAGVLLTPPINGSRRWFKLAYGFSFQPSELAKIALIVIVAWWGERFRLYMSSFWRGLVLPGFFVGLILGLVLLEPDVGTTLLLAAVGCVLLLLAGIRLRYCLPPLIVGVVAIGFFLMQDEIRSKRIYSWLHLEETKTGVGFQAWESRVAFGAGGWAGRGLGSSRQKLGNIVEHHTDFIFPIIAEELGLPATLGVVVLFMTIIWCGFRISARAPDPFGMLLAAGITFLIGLQAFVNIAVVTGVLPNKGLPLPFISYGGSSLILMLGCVGVLLNIARHAVEAAHVRTDDLPAPSAWSPQVP